MRIRPTGFLMVDAHVHVQVLGPRPSLLPPRPHRGRYGAAADRPPPRFGGVPPRERVLVGRQLLVVVVLRDRRGSLRPVRQDTCCTPTPPTRATTCCTPTPPPRTDSRRRCYRAICPCSAAAPRCSRLCRTRCSSSTPRAPQSSWAFSRRPTSLPWAIWRRPRTTWS
jgi:hypothetical protein